MNDAAAEDEDNPYSRLLALKRMGVVKNYEAVRTFTVAVVGMGGVGSVAAEMLARCGLGRLCLFDQDCVAVANMNRLFYRPEHVGQSKVAAAAAVLHAINPDVALETHACDVTTVAGYGVLAACLRGGGVDLVLSCVDNYQARLTINRVCCELGVPWLESGVSENALGGHVQLMLPGRTACFECAPPLLVASEISEATLRRDGVCAASLPTTMGLVAALLAQAALKHLLGFAPVSCFLGYNAFSDYFPRDVLRPNPECPNAACRERQRECRANGTALPPGYDPVDAALRARREQDARAAAQQPVPATTPNKWGIVCIDDGTGAPATSPGSPFCGSASGTGWYGSSSSISGSLGNSLIGSGIYAGNACVYEALAVNTPPPTATQTVRTDPAATVDDLAAQLKAAQSP